MAENYLDINSRMADEVSSCDLSLWEIIGHGSGATIRSIGKTRDNIGIVLISWPDHRYGVPQFFERLTWFSYIYRVIDPKYRCYFPNFYLALVQDKKFLGVCTEQYVPVDWVKEVDSYPSRSTEVWGLHQELSRIWLRYDMQDLAWSLFETKNGPKIGDLELLAGPYGIQQATRSDDDSPIHRELENVSYEVHGRRFEFVVQVNNFL